MVVHDVREPRLRGRRGRQQGPPPVRVVPAIAEGVGASLTAAESRVHLHDQAPGLHRLRGHQGLDPVGPVGYSALRSGVGVGGALLHGLLRHLHVVTMAFSSLESNLNISGLFYFNFSNQANLLKTLKIYC